MKALEILGYLFVPVALVISAVLVWINEHRKKRKTNKNKPAGTKEEKYPTVWILALALCFIGAFAGVNLIDTNRGAIFLLLVSMFGIAWLPGKEFWKAILFPGNWFNE